MKIFEPLFTSSLTIGIDIASVLLIIFSVAIIFRKLQAIFLWGIIILFASLYAGSHYFQLYMLHWILEKSGIILILFFFIIFQPELRRIFEQFRQANWVPTLFKGTTIKSPILIKKILTAVDYMATHKIGAIIVIKSKDSLDTYIESGILLESTISTEILISLFWPGSPTHDGAVIIKDNKIMAAGSLLPLTESKIQDRRLGTRHMAAIGLSEVTDSFIIIISEETGTISMAEKGSITRYLNREALETRLFKLYTEQQGKKEEKRDI